MDTTTKSPVTFTAGALEEIRRIMAEEGFDKSQSLRVGIKGGGCSGLTYLLGFDKQTENDLEYEYEGVRFVMDKAHEIYLQGMEINWENGLSNRGFDFKNPNASSTCGCGTSFAV